MIRLQYSLLIFGIVASAGASEIVIKGSDALGAKLIPKLAERYIEDNPNVKFSIAAEGSDSCFASLLSKECDIGMASRPPTDDERTQFAENHIQFKERIIGYAITAIIVHKDQPVSNMSLQDLEKIYTGEVTDWKVFGGSGKIAAYGKNSSSEHYKNFQRLAMSGKTYGKMVQTLDSGNPHSRFAEDQAGQRAIAYVGLPNASGKGVKIVAVEGIYPKLKDTKKYPLKVELRLYYRADLQREAQGFIDWICSSKDAFAVIEQSGFASIRVLSK